MRLPLLLLLLLVSCAPKGPSTPTYAKGAYRPAPARAPAFSPTEDAPHTFEPGRPSPAQPGPRYAPVPHTPKTRSEDTIWAGNQPQASHQPDRDAPRFFNVPLPLPDDPDPYDKRVAVHCGAAMALAAQWSSTADRYVLIAINRQRCIAASLYAFCTANLAVPADSAKSKRLARLRETAARFAASVCPPDPFADPDVAGVLGPTQKMWIETDAHVRIPL